MRGSSRPEFGTTYRSSMGSYRERLFDTSHGGIGGAPDLDYDKLQFLSDPSCAGPSQSELKKLQRLRNFAAGQGLQDPSLMALSGGGAPSGGLAGYEATREALGMGFTRSDYMEYARNQQLKVFAKEAERSAERVKRLEEYSARCASVSEDVYRWMLNEAVGAGLPVS